jgi:hypothetical protein
VASLNKAALRAAGRAAAHSAATSAAMILVRSPDGAGRVPGARGEALMPQSVGIAAGRQGVFPIPGQLELR